MQTPDILALLAPDSSLRVSSSRANRVLGIDLGTTNSTVAELIYDPASAAVCRARCLDIDQETLEGRYTSPLVPSIVARFHDRTVVGEGARRLRGRMGEFGLSRDRDIFWECKNDIGVRKTYGRAPDGYRTAVDIGGHVLRFLCDAAQGGRAPDRVVVTVPASFQAPQRADTLKAAEQAGLRLEGGDLLDEPLAAFLDYLVGNGPSAFADLSKGRTLLVFDFGGGTCDVAVFTIEPRDPDGPIRVSPRTVSRYHRLGGGDIDLAIVHEVLLPQLLEQNDLQPLDLGYRDKKQVLEPALLAIAEALKVGLCREIRRLQQFRKYDGADRTAVVKVQPGVYDFSVGGETLVLRSPRITAAQFEALLEPFLDHDLLYARETEFRLTGSVFAPIEDALTRARLAPENVDYALLVGGSSLIPQLPPAVHAYLPQANVLSYQNQDDVQTAVARGAAYHALALSVFGRGLVEATCADQIAIRTASGLSTLVPAGAPLPYPRTGVLVNRDLALPRTSMVGEALRVEVVAGSGPDERLVFRELWQIPATVNLGDRLELSFRLDENQVLDLSLTLADSTDTPPFSKRAENPISHVINPQVERQQIAEKEEDIRAGRIPPERLADEMTALGKAYGQLGQKEKAIEYLKDALRRKGSPDADMLNAIAGLYGDLDDWDRQEKFYREAAAASDWTGPLFNLALSQWRRGLHEQAFSTVNASLKRRDSPAYLVLRGLIEGKLGHQDRLKADVRLALESFRSPVSTLDDFELGWYLTAARAVGDEAATERANAEFQRRRTAGNSGSLEGMLPIVAPGLARRPA